MEQTRAARRAAPCWRGRPIAAVLFDLDGTLLDTAADSALALNRAVGEFGWAPVPAGEVRTMIGRGAPTLIRRVAGAQRRALDEAAHAALTERFFHHYGLLQDSDESSARPYAGVREALRELHAAGLRLAIVTNKQRRFAVSLMRRLALEAWIDCIVGGDCCERRKPDPEPLLFACQSLQIPPAKALMVGDSAIDVQAARAAAIPVLCVPYGYNEGEDPRALPGDALIESLALLPALLLDV
jgi:phosphoglycolate phosphatase